MHCRMCSEEMAPAVYPAGTTRFFTLYKLTAGIGDVCIMLLDEPVEIFLLLQSMPVSLVPPLI